MPAFDVTIDEKTYHVEIPDPGTMPLDVIVDGERFRVKIAGAALSVSPQPVSEPAPLPQLPPIALARPAVPASSVMAGGSQVTAPIPGTILSVEVCVGQPVVPGQVLCILEAMKMKNPIRAARAGTVAEIAVTPGQTVAYGAPLLQLS